MLRVHYKLRRCHLQHAIDLGRGCLNQEDRSHFSGTTGAVTDEEREVGERERERERERREEREGGRRGVRERVRETGKEPTGNACCCCYLCSLSLSSVLPRETSPLSPSLSLSVSVSVSLYLSLRVGDLTREPAAAAAATRAGSERGCLLA